MEKTTTNDVLKRHFKNNSIFSQRSSKYEPILCLVKVLFFCDSLYPYITESKTEYGAWSVNREVGISIFVEVYVRKSFTHKLPAIKANPFRQRRLALTAQQTPRLEYASESALVPMTSLSQGCFEQTPIAE